MKYILIPIPEDIEDPRLPLEFYSLKAALDAFNRGVWHLLTVFP